jgi:alpha-N-acetylglucosaminidase
MRRSRSILTLVVLFCLTSGSTAAHAGQTDAVAALVKRVVPTIADRFDLAVIPADAGRDVFEIESTGDRIALRGNNGVSIASALNWYLKYDCHCQLSWCGDNLNLPPTLPTQPKLRIVSPFADRVAFNFCTFSYTMPWWDWDRWQREIDWMAMHGINMPLAITGEEAVWQAVLRKYGFNDDESRTFLCGPGFFAWQYMANLEGWGGPLPQSWIDSHLKLGQQILARERELGMTPILTGFTGFVPRKLAEKYPNARIQFKPPWCGFPGAAQLDPLDPLFADFGKTFIEEQTKLLGTDHWYTADPFHESAPPSNDPTYMPAVAKTILATLQSADPDAKIAMQTWSMRAPIVQAIPADKILLLDLEGHKWSGTDGFWGRPWVRGVIHNFGGRAFLGGDVPWALDGPANLLANPKAGHLAGVGYFPEGTGQNPVFYEAALESAWYDKAPDEKQWMGDYVHARYGKADKSADAAWDILGATAYHSTPASLESPYCLRPSLAGDQGTFSGDFRRNYPPAAVWNAWPLLQSASPQLGKVDTYQYDLVDLGRQCLADLSVAMLHDVSKAYESGDAEQFKAESAKFLELAGDMDALLATRREFLLGKWIGDARKWGTTDAEKNLYEKNARLQVTVWGRDMSLEDYSNRQWAGLIGGYYVPRWKQYLDFLTDHPKGTGDRAAFGKQLTAWEYRWCDGGESYPVEPIADPVEVSAKMLAKWQPVQAELYTRFDVQTVRPIGVDEVKLPPKKLAKLAWAPADCSQSYRDWEIDVSDKIKTPGVYTVAFKYTSGHHALKIEKVSIGQAVDTHDGWTGSDTRENTYRLDVKAVEPGTQVILRAHVATDAGTDSNGVIEIAPVPAK